MWSRPGPSGLRGRWVAGDLPAGRPRGSERGRPATEVPPEGFCCNPGPGLERNSSFPVVSADTSGDAERGPCLERRAGDVDPHPVKDHERAGRFGPHFHQPGAVGRCCIGGQHGLPGMACHANDGRQPVVGSAAARSRNGRAGPLRAEPCSHGSGARTGRTGKHLG